MKRSHIILTSILLTAVSIVFVLLSCWLTEGTGTPPPDPIILTGPDFQLFEGGTPDASYDGQSNCVVEFYSIDPDHTPDTDPENIGENPFRKDSGVCIRQDPVADTKDCDHNDRMANIKPKPSSQFDVTTDPDLIEYVVDASDYSYLIFHYYLAKMGRKDGFLAEWKAGGDNFYIQIFHYGGETQIWTNNLRNYPDKAMKPGEWGQVVANLSDPGWTGNKIDKSGIYKITVCQYDDFTMWLDDFWFSESLVE